MPQSQFSPSFPGIVSAQGFVSTVVPGTTIRYIPQRITVHTNGSTEVNVFGTTNGIAGTFVGTARVIAKDPTAGNITMQYGGSGNPIAFTIAKGTAEGGVVGTAFAAIAFGINGTTTVKSSGGNAAVEIDFVMSDPRLVGAQ